MDPPREEIDAFFYTLKNTEVCKSLSSIIFQKNCENFWSAKDGVALHDPNLKLFFGFSFIYFQKEARNLVNLTFFPLPYENELLFELRETAQLLVPEDAEHYISKFQKPIAYFISSSIDLRIFTDAAATLLKFLLPIFHRYTDLMRELARLSHTQFSRTFLENFYVIPWLGLYNKLTKRFLFMLCSPLDKSFGLHMANPEELIPAVELEKLKQGIKYN